jgi:hypothetical protein
MIRILLDIKLKYRFQECNPGFLVSTVTGKRWTGLKNGNLLIQAQRQFDVFVTVDQNIPYQQALSTYNMAFIVLRATSNRYKALLTLVKPACEVIESAKAGKVYEIVLNI